MLKINWKTRLLNPYFWFGLIAVILAAVGVSAESLTSWDVLYSQILTVMSNPFQIGCIAVALVGYLNDPTTSGLSDSTRALSYEKPAANCKQEATETTGE